MGKNIIYNIETQYYKDIPIRLIVRKSYSDDKAKRFVLGDSNQNIWIPNCYLEENGTLKEGANIDFIFKKAYWQKKLEYAKININPLRWF